jgi:hypothetical protein
MSRGRVHEVSSPISLFPFIGILLCTMGALLVILVAVSKSAKNTAVREVQSQQHSDAKEAIEGTHKKLEEVNTYVASLNAVKVKATTRLTEEQLRLSQVEDHIRRLHERIQALQSAAVELQALEKEHYDDHQQAQREIDRLHKLIADSQKSIEALQEDGSKKSRSYAVVPYEGPNGTYRRPIYIECVRGGLVLQPEGVRLTADDLRPPIGPGNPLASVLRATRDHLVRLNPTIGESRDLSPYPLLLVRPEGLMVYDRARQAIEAGDFDMGFELCESDWKLKFPEADPQLAAVEMTALDQSRARQQILAAAAPRAYGNSSMESSGAFDDDDGYGGGGSGGGGGGGGQDGGGRGGTRDYVVHNDRHDGDDEYGGESDGDGGSGAAAGGSSGGNGGSGAKASGPGGAASEGGGSIGTTDVAGSSGGSSPGGEGGGAPSGIAKSAVGAGSPGGSFSGGGGGQPPSVQATDKSLTPDGYQTEQSASVMAGTPSPSESSGPSAASDPRSEKEKAMAAANHSKDWALKQKPPRAIPVRRTIRVAVAKDQVAILPDSGPATSGGKAIPLRGDTVESVDEFVKQVRDHIDGWGIAGTNLYWRPVVVLNVAPGGQQRANDLTRLLKNSGLEIRADETAKNLPQGSAHETR